MDTEQEEVLKWSCIEQAENWEHPEKGDGYTESEVYRAVNKMYEKCKEMWELDAEKWKALIQIHDSILTAKRK